MNSAVDEASSLLIITILMMFFNDVFFLKNKPIGPVRESNPGPLAPEARIIPLDQQADAIYLSAKPRVC